MQTTSFETGVLMVDKWDCCLICKFVRQFFSTYWSRDLSLKGMMVSLCKISGQPLSSISPISFMFCVFSMFEMFKLLYAYDQSSYKPFIKKTFLNKIIFMLDKTLKKSVNFFLAIWSLKFDNLFNEKWKEKLILVSSYFFPYWKIPTLKT